MIFLGSENLLLVVEIVAQKDPTEEGLITMQVRKERELTNAGVSVAGIRPDRRLLATGGWDHRIRIFSWKHPEKAKPLAVLPFHTQAIKPFNSVISSQGPINLAQNLNFQV